MSGLTHYFGGHWFSSYAIQSWKPAPGLFLYAAAAMGFSPSECLVVDDSLVGIEAAAAAGMRALRYKAQGDANRTRGEFSDRSDLPVLVRDIL